jgi:hypothetical protein
MLGTMLGTVLAVTMLVSSTAVSPTLQTSRATGAPVDFTFRLPQGADTSPNLPHRRSLKPAQTTTPKRYNMTDRIIATVAGACVGWIAGGTIGFRATSTSNPDDDTSGLRGMMIGAPIGAVAGALIGNRLTK